MPLHDARSDVIKVHRPVGVKYAEAEAEWQGLHNEQRAISRAIEKATSAFFQEFGRYPVWDMLVVEIVCVTGRVHATVFESVEDNRSLAARRADARAWNETERRREEA